MSSTVSVPIYQTIYRLGTLYSGYRLIIAFCLIIIFLITLENQPVHYEYPSLYFYSIATFTIIAALQMMLLKFYPHGVAQQFIGFFIVDIPFLSILVFALNGPNLAISILFVIAVFTANFLLSKNKALFITLVSVIAIIYQQFLGSYFDFSNLNNISNSALLAFLFFMVYGIGQIAINRFQVLESLNTYQSLELFKLQNINRYILEQIEVGYLVLDEKCKIIVSNPAACSLLGISPLYAHEQYHLSNFQPDLYEILKDAMFRDGERFQFESQQSSFTVDIRVQKLIVPHQALTLLVLEDAQKINQKVQQLKLAALGQLSASIAHEIRNPLAAIAQANDLFLMSDEQQQALLHQMITKQTVRINSIIKDTLDMAKNKKTHASQIDLPLFLEDLLLHDLSDAQAKIQTEIEADLVIYFDDSQLRQVLVNLLRNALRHNDQNAEYVLVKAFKNDAHICIDVIDYGKGVTKQDLSQLFQPFFSTEINGTGLGLYLSQTICEANQAKLIYVEQKQQGACFRIECPRMD
ncbi:MULTISPECIES: sensor histidine kinase [Acinetobacter]|nr:MULTISPECIES: ATP-binding protein [Acinetobacter]ELW89024.1 GHKL domain protein [Acinetobacter sp. WC-743]KKW80609.1 histidine kinase [Acinetobacter sp. Ag2]MBI0395796.1 histidine kinase [Acinetobacter bereziniae]MBJ8423760.1 histidine kinase [Acinetobacter bereziniae]MBJ8427473.1 histidine kinase [Acinetobacter bereziniae]